MNREIQNSREQPRIQLDSVDHFFAQYPTLEVYSSGKLVESYSPSAEETSESAEELLQEGMQSILRERMLYQKQYDDLKQALPKSAVNDLPEQLANVPVEGELVKGVYNERIQMLLNRVANLAEADYQLRKADEVLLQELKDASSVRSVPVQDIKETTDEELVAK